MSNQSLSEFARDTSSVTAVAPGALKAFDHDKLMDDLRAELGSYGAGDQSINERIIKFVVGVTEHMVAAGIDRDRLAAVLATAATVHAMESNGDKPGVELMHGLIDAVALGQGRGETIDGH